eukprot:jgi/Bigna1/92210/estExt_fgenesh1_pm.C_70005
MRRVIREAIREFSSLRVQVQKAVPRAESNHTLSHQLMELTTINVPPKVAEDFYLSMDSESEWESIEAIQTLRENAALEKLAHRAEEAFYVINLARLRAKHLQWKDLLARVEPFYAIKCNPDHRLLNTLNSMGCGFDCASILEMEAALGAGASPQQIIYANPCKPSHHLEGAKKLGVTLSTFDSCSELIKIAKIHPGSELILRILVDDSSSVCQMGKKYGASLESVPQLLDVAKKLGLSVVGVSFHVGSGCRNAEAFSDAVTLARKAFDIAHSKGFSPRILDVGEVALDESFPADSGVRIIAEPGRYYATSTHTLAARVIGRREPNHCNLIFDQKSQKFQSQAAPGYMYYINDGLYGSFNCVLYDHIDVSATSHPECINMGSKMSLKNGQEDEAYACSIWGPTCDGLDCVMTDAHLPLLEEGDWLSFRNMGAYTNAAGSNFNGFMKPKIFYID